MFRDFYKSPFTVVQVNLGSLCTSAGASRSVLCMDCVRYISGFHPLSFSCPGELLLYILFIVLHFQYLSLLRIFRNRLIKYPSWPFYLGMESLTDWDTWLPLILSHGVVT